MKNSWLEPLTSPNKSDIVMGINNHQNTINIPLHHLNGRVMAITEVIHGHLWTNATITFSGLITGEIMTITKLNTDGH